MLRLREAIIDGEFALGAVISEEMIAQSFGVSRTPVREAMGQLQLQGLVVIRPQVGSFVFTPSADDIQALCAFRIIIEPKAAELAYQGGRHDLTDRGRRAWRAAQRCPPKPLFARGDWAKLTCARWKSRSGSQGSKLWPRGHRAARRLLRSLRQSLSGGILRAGIGTRGGVASTRTRTPDRQPTKNAVGQTPPAKESPVYTIDLRWRIAARRGADAPAIASKPGGSEIHRFSCGHCWLCGTQPY